MTGEVFTPEQRAEIDRIVAAAIDRPQLTADDVRAIISAGLSEAVSPGRIAAALARYARKAA